MPLFELKIEIAPGAAGVADDLLLERGAANWSVLEDVIQVRAWLVGLAERETALRAEWDDLLAALADVGVRPAGPPERRELGDADWRDSYKAHFHAWQFGALHWVPVWERETFQLPSGHTVLWLDPGLAFGTGNHETTRLCCERLVALADERRGPTSADADPAPAGSLHGIRVVDAGCGSGILALSAARLGFEHVSGFDNDTEAVRVSQDNAELNGLAGRVKFFVGDLDSGLAGRQAEIVLANILANVLTRFAPELIRAVAPGGALVLSGILTREVADVRAAFAARAPGWTSDSRTLGEWSDVLLRRPAE